MSNVLHDTEQPCDTIHAPCDGVLAQLRAKDRDLGGLSVRRLLPTREQKMVGPWIFFDHMGPAQFPAGSGINVRPHPHIGIATVTYLFQGEILHRDSLGSLQVIQPGDINLMVTGSGMVHSERERPQITDRDHQLEGLQLWLALPDSDQETDPAFHHYPADNIPHVNIEGVPIRVMMGRAYGVLSPVPVFSDTLYCEARLSAGQSLTLPEADERAVYVVSGRLTVSKTEMPAHSMTVFAGHSRITVTASEDSSIAVIGGASVGKRYIEWNFVSSSKKRIEQAKDDWRNGRFAKVPGDQDEFIPLPGSTTNSFALSQLRPG